MPKAWNVYSMATMDTSCQGASSSLFLYFGNCYGLCFGCIVFRKGGAQLPIDIRGISPNLTESLRQIFLLYWKLHSCRGQGGISCRFSSATHISKHFTFMPCLANILIAMSSLVVFYSGLWVWFRKKKLLKLFRVPGESKNSLWESKQVSTFV